jgi:hypothetical protein
MASGGNPCSQTPQRGHGTIGLLFGCGSGFRHRMGERVSTVVLPLRSFRICVCSLLDGYCNSRCEDSQPYLSAQRAVGMARVGSIAHSYGGGFRDDPDARACQVHGTGCSAGLDAAFICGLRNHAVCRDAILRRGSQYLEFPFTLMANVILVVGAFSYLRNKETKPRVLSLLMGTSVMISVAALGNGIYWHGRQESWMATPANGYREALGVAVMGAVLLILMFLPALLRFRTSRKELMIG